MAKEYQPKRIDMLAAARTKVVTMGEQDIDKTLVHIVAAETPKLRPRHITAPYLVGEDIFDSVASLEDAAADLMKDGKASKILQLPKFLNEWEGDILGRSISMRNNHTNTIRQVGYVLAADQNDQHLVVLNNGLAVIGEPSPAMEHKDRQFFNPSVHPILIREVDETAYDKSGTLKDSYANRIVQILEEEGLVITAISGNSDHLDTIDAFVDNRLRWVDSVKVQRDAKIGQAFDPILEHVENLLRSPIASEEVIYRKFTMRSEQNGVDDAQAA